MLSRSTRVSAMAPPEGTPEPYHPSIERQGAHRPAWSVRCAAPTGGHSVAARKFRSVAIPLAHNISTPFWTTDTLASPTERVFPADRAVPHATSDDPIAGANILTEKSTVAFPQPTGSSVATDHPAAISAKVPIGPA